MEIFFNNKKMKNAQKYNRIFKYKVECRSKKKKERIHK